MQEFGRRFRRDGSGGIEVLLHDIPKRCATNRTGSCDPSKIASPRITKIVRKRACGKGLCAPPLCSLYHARLERELQPAIIVKASEQDERQSPEGSGEWRLYRRRRIAPMTCRARTARKRRSSRLQRMRWSF